MSLLSQVLARHEQKSHNRRFSLFGRAAEDAPYGRFLLATDQNPVQVAGLSSQQPGPWRHCSLAAWQLTALQVKA